MNSGPNRYKYCASCGESKLVAEFYQRKTGYYDRFCKPCSISDVARRKAEKRRIAREARLAEPAPTEIECTKCATVQPMAHFYVAPSGRVRRECNDCRAAYLEAWRDRNRTHIAVQSKTYKDGEAERRRKRTLARYGLTPATYDTIYDAQQGRCLICAAPKGRVGSGRVGGGDVLCVDHHHGDGRVRGLLCSPCNRAIGLLGDNPDRLRAAIAYLVSGELNGQLPRDGADGDGADGQRPDRLPVLR